jgi:hypothetical protein
VSLYDYGLATYDAADTFHHEDAAGFVRLWGQGVATWSARQQVPSATPGTAAPGSAAPAPAPAPAPAGASAPAEPDAMPAAGSAAPAGSTAGTTAPGDPDAIVLGPADTSLAAPGTGTGS